MGNPRGAGRKSYKTLLRGFNVTVHQGLKDVTIVSVGQFKKCPENTIGARRRQKDKKIYVNCKYKDYPQVKIEFAELLQAAKYESLHTSAITKSDRDGDKESRPKRGTKSDKTKGPKTPTPGVLDSAGGDK